MSTGRVRNFFFIYLSCKKLICMVHCSILTEDSMGTILGPIVRQMNYLFPYFNFISFFTGRS